MLVSSHRPLSIYPDGPFRSSLAKLYTFLTLLLWWPLCPQSPTVLCQLLYLRLPSLTWGSASSVRSLKSVSRPAWALVLISTSIHAHVFSQVCTVTTIMLYWDSQIISLLKYTGDVSTGMSGRNLLSDICEMSSSSCHPDGYVQVHQ